MVKIGSTPIQTHKKMRDSKKKAEAPKKVEAKKPEALKPKSKPKTLGELKKEFAAARKAHPEQDDAIRAEYLKRKATLQGK